MPTAKPPVISDRGETETGRQTKDTAYFLVFPYQFERPTLSIPGGEKYEFPLGTEGFRLTGSAQLAVHRYIGGNSAEVEVIHKDEARIEISGAFPGKTSDKNMGALRDILVKETPDQGKILSLPGIFPRTQMVVMESYEFQHPEDERTDSIFYNITFVRVGTGKKVVRKDISKPPPNPTQVKKKKKGIGERKFTVRDNARTLRTIAKIIYKDAGRWSRIYDMNHVFVDSLKLPQHKIPTYKWKIGTIFRY